VHRGRPVSPRKTEGSAVHGLRTFWSELQRRNVLRAGVLYAASAWLLVQIATQVFPFFQIPEWVVRWIVVACVIGAPFWLGLAWFYELTPEGLKRGTEGGPRPPGATGAGRKLDYAIIAVLAVAVVVLAANTLVWRKGAGLQPDDRDVAALLSKVPARSVAVLPMANESGDAGQQYFSDGISEDLITALSQFAGLKVISRNSSFQFRNSDESTAMIGARLGVAHLLEGSVQHDHGEVRIRLELIRAADGTALWSQRYVRPYRDLFSLQDEITAACARALKAKLLAGKGAPPQSDRPPSGNLAAYQTYQQGDFFLYRNTQPDLRTAVEQYAKATQLDPKYAAAWAGQSFAWTVLAESDSDSNAAAQAYDKARTAANTAVSLAPGLAMTHLARGYLLLAADLDWVGAQAEYQRAAQLAPNDSKALFGLGNLAAILGDPRRAVQLTRRALGTDPLHADWYNSLSLYLIALGRLDEAQAAVDRAIEFQPAADFFHLQSTIIAIRRGSADAALEAAGQESSVAWREVATTMARQIGGDHAAADAALKSLIGKLGSVAAYQIAEVYALRGDPDNAFSWLDRALANRDPGIRQLLFDPFLLRYDHDPRFAAFCRKAGLPVPQPAPRAIGAAAPVGPPR
jgi:TolB-like protein